MIASDAGTGILGNCGELLMAAAPSSAWVIDMVGRCADMTGVFLGCALMASDVAFGFILPCVWMSDLRDENVKT